MTSADALATEARLPNRPWLPLTSASNLALSSASVAYSAPTEMPPAISSPAPAAGRRTTASTASDSAGERAIRTAGPVPRRRAASRLATALFGPEAADEHQEPAQRDARQLSHEIDPVLAHEVGFHERPGGDQVERVRRWRPPDRPVWGWAGLGGVGVHDLADQRLELGDREPVDADELVEHRRAEQALGEPGDLVRRDRLGAAPGEADPVERDRRRRARTAARTRCRRPG